ncbi:MAG: DUF255 domain-containing protein [Candidatus Marinimicrobia bacterium]|nr:DUF255 domain-containing protein [Candidatus Neomarinimicrobiota bacterium]
MKRLFMVLFLVVSLSLFYSCNKSESSKTKEKTQTEQVTKTKEETQTEQVAKTKEETQTERVPKTKEENVVEKSEPHEWYGFQEGLKIAEQEQKHIIIDFYADWCKWCKVMDEKTFSLPFVEKYLFAHFVPIRVNTESKETVTFKGQTFSLGQLSGAFGVTGLPSLAFLTPEQEMVTLIPGYIEKDKFMIILEFISKECYKKQIPFDTFQEHDDCK